MSQVTRIFPAGVEDLSHAVELFSYAEMGPNVVATIMFDGYPTLTATWDGTALEVYQHSYGDGDFRQTIVAQFLVYVGAVSPFLPGLPPSEQSSFIERVEGGAHLQSIADEYEIDFGSAGGKLIGLVEEHLMQLYPEFMP